MNDKAFITLPLLDYLISQNNSSKQDLSNIAMVSVQHLLETTGSMFESILELGIPKNQVFISGKLYSNDLRTINKLERVGFTVIPSSDSTQLGNYYDLLKKDCYKLWEVAIESIKGKAIDSIIILDDGGVLLQTIPNSVKENYKLVGIEQTSSGVKLNKNPDVSIINVARSIVKTQVEPAFISQAVIQKTRMRLIDLNPKTIGIIGFGTIGKGLYHDLKSTFNIILFDNNEGMTTDDRILYDKHSASLKALYLQSDVIIGATGTDVSFLPLLNKMTKDKLLMSVSSGDTEFKTMLRALQNNNLKGITSILNDIECRNEKGCLLTILRGGTPVNFDNNIHSVLPEYIQLTRGLLLLSIIQAIRQVDELCTKKEFIELNLKGQLNLLMHFIELQDVDLTNFEFIPPLERLLEHKVIEDSSTEWII